VNSESLDALSFCNVLKDMYLRGNVTLPDGETKPISSASTLNNLLTIRAIIKAHQPTSTLEIGLAYGASALTILSSMSEFVGADYQHTAIDPFQSPVWKSVGKTLLADAGHLDRFRCIEERSCVVLPDLWKTEERFDLIYVDGSHLFEDVFIDFFYGVRILGPDGHLLFDDCTDPHVRKVVSFIDKNYQAILKRVDVKAGIKKSLKRRIGNKLGYRQMVVYKKISAPPRRWDAEFKKF